MGQELFYGAVQYCKPYRGLVVLPSCNFIARLGGPLLPTT